jgi:hypothetical protein
MLFHVTRNIEEKARSEVYCFMQLIEFITEWCSYILHLFSLPSKSSLYILLKTFVPVTNSSVPSLLFGSGCLS